MSIVIESKRTQMRYQSAKHQQLNVLPSTEHRWIAIVGAGDIEDGTLNRQF